jgi:hypothetical protein
LRAGLAEEAQRQVLRAARALTAGLRIGSVEVTHDP